MRGRRVLVGRRFEDFKRVGVAIDLSLSEKLWHNLITDYRYQFYLDRRKVIRRSSDIFLPSADEIYRPVSTALRFIYQAQEALSEIHYPPRLIE